MGTARNVSWSYSRHSLYEECPRAFFYQYFAWGEPYEDEAWFFSRTSSMPLLIGDIAHRSIVSFLRHWKLEKAAPIAWKDYAVADLRSSIAESAANVRRLQSNKRPWPRTTTLQEHLFSGTVDLGEAEDRLLLLLNNFEASSALKAIKRSNPKRWLDICDHSQPKQYVLAKRDLGFTNDLNLRVYTAFDFAFKQGAYLHIVDWKTGERSEQAATRAREQLTTYALRAIADGLDLRSIRIRSVWLRSRKFWRPLTLSRQDLQSAVALVERDHEREMRLLNRDFDSEGKTIFRANEKDFPTCNRATTCIRCKYSLMCPVGRRLYKQSDATSKAG